jgi:chloride channel protein, CIC family
MSTDRPPRKLHRTLDSLRLRLSRAEALPQLATLGVICGLLTGLVIIAFRLLIEVSQSLFLPGADPENYEGLDMMWRFLLPFAGGLVLGLVFQFLPTESRNVGVVHVMERLSYHQGRLPWRNAIVQFFGGALSIIAGHSVGREGPAIHLGAASGSIAGRYLGLPNNSLRVLAGCGVAAAIAAAFNTPLAGVVFAMEVVIMEYTVAGFAPVILAAVSATALSQFVYGAAPAFSVPQVALGSLFELPFILALGMIIGALAAAFIVITGFFAARFKAVPVWARLTLAGTITGLLALLVPEIMSIGYDTVNAALLGQLALVALGGIVVFKLLATAAGVGLGLPGGMIGPVLVLGAAAGGLLGILGQTLAPGDASTPGLYALLGMGAMMAGALQAPLAALTAVLELTGNPHIIMPGMLAVIAASLTARVVFHQPSVYVVLLRGRGLDYRNDPVTQSLRRLGVGGSMDGNVTVLPRTIAPDRAQAELALNPDWILVRDGEKLVALQPAMDLARALKEQPEATELDLLAIPAQRSQVAGVLLQATLQEALEKLDATGAEAVYVSDDAAPGSEHVYGVLTRERIERSYRYN